MNVLQHVNPKKSNLEHQKFQGAPKQTFEAWSSFAVEVGFNCLPRLFENEFILPAAAQFLLPNKTLYFIIIDINNLPSSCSLPNREVAKRNKLKTKSQKYREGKKRSWHYKIWGAENENMQFRELG